jgi:uncharacterized protein (DUF4415 family)
MAVTRKPKQQTPEDFISQGGSTTMVADREVTTAPAQEEKKRGRPPKEKEDESSLKLRLSMSLLEQIDAAVGDRKPSPSRHQWILEAIYEKLDRATKA